MAQSIPLKIRQAQCRQGPPTRMDDTCCAIGVYSLMPGKNRGDLGGSKC